jgi:hypothetical protein
LLACSRAQTVANRADSDAATGDEPIPRASEYSLAEHRTYRIRGSALTSEPALEIDLLVPLVVLALVDSTSFGTLLIPIWLMLAPGRPRSGNIVLFLATVAVFYLALGVSILAGILALEDQITWVLSYKPFRVAQFVLGVLLVVLGVTIEPWTTAGKAKKAAARQARRAARGPGRLEKLRHNALAGAASPGAVMALALSATAIEAASMLPYLGALGLLSASGLSFHQSSLILIGYCLIMIAPALALLLIRIGLHQRISGVLESIEGWMSRHAGEMTAWVLFLVGLFLTNDAAQALTGK